MEKFNNKLRPLERERCVALLARKR